MNMVVFMIRFIKYCKSFIFYTNFQEKERKLNKELSNADKQFSNMIHLIEFEGE